MTKKILLFILLIITPVLVLAYPKGDVNGDNSVNTMDYVLVRNHILKKQVLTGNELTRADVDGKNGVDMMDYVLIRNIILNDNNATNSSPSGSPMSYQNITINPTSLILSKNATSTFSIKLTKVEGILTFKINNPSIITWNLSNKFIDDNACDIDNAQTLTCDFEDSENTLTLKGVNSGTTTIDIYFEKGDMCEEISEDDEKCDFTGTGKIGVLVK